jgi:hypothetical protein
MNRKLPSNMTFEKIVILLTVYFKMNGVKPEIHLKVITIFYPKKILLKGFFGNCLYTKKSSFARPKIL